MSVAIHRHDFRDKQQVGGRQFWAEDGLDDDDKPREECGVFGIYAPGVSAARVTFFALFALQHRGQEGAGIASTDGVTMNVQRGSGLVSQVFDEHSMNSLKGHIALGHTRYSTTGASVLQNTQPFVIETMHGPIALAHNGQLAKAPTLRKQLMQRGIGMFTQSDSEVLVQMLASPPKEGETRGPDWEGRIQQFMSQTQGAYSCVLLTTKALFAFRDPLGMRPLALGKIKTEAHPSTTPTAPATTAAPSEPHEFWTVASESCAFSTLKAEFVRDVRPGEIIRIDSTGLHSRQCTPAPRPAFCVFEYVYFARPDSVIEDRLVHHVRQSLGRQLAKEHPTPGADIVVGVPDSSTPIAIGYSQESGIPFTEGLTKNRYIQRTFIAPDQNMRVEGVGLKYNPLSANLMGKNVVLVDDSIVRGTTVKKLVLLLKSAGAKSVHVRIGSPPLKNPCYMGIDMKTGNELIAHNVSIAEVTKFIEADSLAYLSHDGMINTVHNESQVKKEGVVHSYCSACFSGEYPLDVDTW